MMVAARGLVKKLLKRNPMEIWAWPQRNRVRMRTAALVWREGGGREGGREGGRKGGREGGRGRGGRREGERVTL